MSPKWMIFLVMLWVCVSMFGAVLEGSFLGGDEQSHLNVLMNAKILTSTTVVGKIVGAFTDLEMWQAIAGILIWDFSFWEGSYEIVRWILFLPVSIGILFSLITVWVRGVGAS